MSSPRKADDPQGHPMGRRISDTTNEACGQASPMGLNPDYRPYDPGDVRGVLNCLRLEIEHMAGDNALGSDRAITPGGREHTVIKNGYPGDGRQDMAPRSLLTMCAATVEICTAMRQAAGQKCQLVWRVMPDYDPFTGSLYLRLCFEPI